jgi:predicted MFS family arabinose efflux permease
MAGAGVAIAGHVASAFMSSYPLLPVARVLAGLGGGIAFAAGSACRRGCRRSAEPDGAMCLACASASAAGGFPLRIEPEKPLDR